MILGMVIIFLLLMWKNPQYCFAIIDFYLTFALTNTIRKVN